MASKADEYRHRARQCLELAGRFRDAEARVTLSHMAGVWLRLADFNEDAGKMGATFQQQQQIQPKKDR